MTAMRGAVLFAFSFLLACSGGDKIHQVSRSLSVFSRTDGPTSFSISVEFTMPKGFPVEINSNVAMTDTSNRRFEATAYGLSTDSNGEQRVNAKFDVAEGSHVRVVHVDQYDIDMSSRRVTRRAAASTAP
jgi:hypothetical protein